MSQTSGNVGYMINPKVANRSSDSTESDTTEDDLDAADVLDHLLSTSGHQTHQGPTVRQVKADVNKLSEIPGGLDRTQQCK